MIHDLFIENSGSDDWYCDFVDVSLPDINSPYSPIYRTSVSFYTWTKNKGQISKDIRAVTRRKITGYSGYEGWGGTYYLSGHYTGKIEHSWGGTITDQYGSYNAMAHEDAPTMTYSVSNDAVGRDWLTFTEPSPTTGAKISIDRKKLFDAMAAAPNGTHSGIGYLTITVKLGFPQNTTNSLSKDVKLENGKYVKEMKYTFYRRCFQMGDASISQTPTFSPRTGYNYLNQQYRDVTITMSPTSIFCGSITAEQKETIVQNFGCSAALYLGNSASDKLCDMSMTKSGGTLTFKGRIPMDKAGSANDGVLLKLDNIYSYYDFPSDGTLEKYYLENGGTSFSHYFSTHKVDTKAPSVMLTNVNGTEISIQNTIRSQHDFYIVSSETLYPEANTPHNDSNQRFLRYELYQKNGGTYGSSPTAITGYLGSGSQTQVKAPVNTTVLTDAKIHLMPAARTEGQYKLRIYGWDDANNGLNGGSFYEIENIYLDRQAPRVSVTETVQNQAVDGTKRNDYTFAITDLQTSQASGSWARTYYCFVEDGQEMPNPDLQTIEQSTGEIDVITEKWAFVEGGAETATALLKVQKGTTFEGKLYYYTADSSGNDSRAEQNGKYFSKDVKIYNYDSRDTLITEAYTHPKGSYNIQFDMTDTNYITEYKWESSDSSFAQDYIPYTGEENVGAAQQLDSEEISWLLDGNYTLTYKVTELNSGNWREYTKDYVFDNASPKIKTTWLTDSSQLLQTQQLKLEINDVSGVESATYLIVNPDGTPIEGYEATPVTITMTADNRGTVNEILTFSLPQNGVYGLKINAEDKNSYQSDTELLTFGNRNEKPQITSLSHNLSDNVDGYGATSNGEYILNLDLSDSVKNVSSLQIEQDVRYCISTNGADYGGWITAADIEKEPGSSSISYSLTLENPLTLSEGWNTLYIKTACVNVGNLDDPKSSVVSDAQSIKLLYDKTPPMFDMPSYSTTNWTKEDVTVIINASDAGTGVCTLKAHGETPDIIISTYSEGQFIVTVKENVTRDLVLSDSLGNETLVPLSVQNIDKLPPEAEAISENHQSGARTDGKVEITIFDQTDVQASFALVKDPTPGQVLTESDYIAFNTSTVSVEQSETLVSGDELKVKTYTLRLKGLEGTYAVGIKATDTVGNVSEVLFTGQALSLTDAEPQIVSVICEPAITKSTTTATLQFNVPLVVLPDPPGGLSNLSESELENLLSSALLEANEEFVNEYSLVCRSAAPVSIIVMDEAERTAILTFTPDADFVDGFNISAHIEKNGQIIPNGGFISFLPEDTISYIVNPSNQYQKQIFYVDNAEYSGMQLNEQRSVIDAVYGQTQDTVAYTSLCFDALHDGKTTKSVRFSSYTFEGNEEERLEEDYLAISVVDETTPKGIVTYSETKPTNQNVMATITMSDNESGITKLEKSYDGGANYVDTIATTEYTEVFAQNGTVQFRLHNGAGMTSIITATVANIDKTSIVEGIHYTVDYSFENYLGEWVPITEGKAYRRVMAVVNPISNSGKELLPTNNGGSFTRMLTASDNRFTFEFTDTAGNIGYKEVEYSLFDNQPGTTTWVLSSNEKTNQNIYAFLTITDEASGIAYVEVKKDGVVYPVTDPLENEYMVELDSSGTYQVTAFDGAGNSWTEAISISNIDKIAPQVLTKLYSTPIGTITSRSVRVELTEFNKDISTIRMTGIELVSGLTNQDIIYTPGEKVIRFKKNGSITVKFVDEFGNEGFDVVTVANICTDPPAVEAVVVLAPDLLSVDVTFDKLLDDDGVPVDRYRELSDLMVTYKGITYQLATKKFTLKSNGSYEFVVHDSSGASQKIMLNVTGIDDQAPVITEVRWEYKYRLENQNGIWEERTHTKTIEPGKDTSGLESGYRIAADENNPETNQNVNVIVTTNKETTFIGGRDAMSMQKEMEYRENGLFNFNLQAKNSTSATYGVDIKLIDKTPPVITLDNGSELIFIEGMTKEREPMYAYDRAKLMDYHAYDIKDGVRVDLTDQVKISYGVGGRVFDPDNINNNEFVRSNPYYVEYTVYDAAGNGTTLRRTIRLVGFYDTIALVNGRMPDSTNVATVMGDKIEISLKNFSGIAYARYEKGIFTQGQMKTQGISLTQRNGIFTVDKAAEGWYTVYVQTDKRDYFNILIYVVPQNEESQGESK